MMGCAIAASHLRCGFRVILCDNATEMLESAPQRIAEELRLQNCTFDEMLLHCSTTLESVRPCPILIETITEKLRLKQKLYDRLFQVVSRTHQGEYPSHSLAKGRYLLFTNTSTIAISKLAQNLPEEWRRCFCGFHFFHPVRANSLLEIIPGRDTATETIEWACHHAKRIAKRPIVVGDGPGFLVNRILNPYLVVAQQLLHEGVPMQRIELAATNFGMRMGPFRIMDEIGLDVVLHAGWVLHKSFPDRVPELPLLLKLVDLRRLGRKTGRGFMLYDNAVSWNGAGLPDPELPLQVEAIEMTETEIQRRLFYAMYEEALRCRDDGVIADLADADVASVEALGFPRKKGGIVSWGRQTDSAR